MNARQRWVVCFALIAVLAAGFFISERRSQKSAKPDFFNKERLMRLGDETLPVASNCPNPQTKTLKYKSRALIHHEFVDFYHLSNNAAAAVEKHLKYLNGFFNSQPRAEAAWHNIGAPRFKIFKTSNSNYGIDGDYDPVADYVTYPSSFQKTRKLRKADKAMTVEYEAEQDVVVCSTKSKLPETVDLILPRDPYLAFWAVTRGEREDLLYYGIQAVTNPCADHQIVDLTQPSMYWYVWNPTAKGTNRLGKPYDCKAKINDAWTESATAQVLERAVEAKPIDFSKLFSVPKLQASMVFGFVGRDDPSEILKRAKPIFMNRDLREVARDSKTREQVNKVDVSAWALVQFIDGFSEIADLDTVQTSDRGSYLQFDIRGRLKESKKPIDFNIYYGATDDRPGFPAHWQFLKEALETSQMIFYVGHSGMGTDINLETLQKHLNISADDLRASMAGQPYQLLSIISCYSMVYYNDQFLNYRPQDQQHTSDLLVMGNGTYKFGLPLAVLRYLDLHQQGEKVSLAKAVGLMLGGNEMAYFQRR